MISAINALPADKAAAKDNNGGASFTTGASFRGKRAIWGGRKKVRSVLYMAALTARRLNPVIGAFAQRLKIAGKSFKAIQVACIRKLLVILNTMLKTNTHWRTITA